MKSVVIDASVIIKWLFPEKPHENNVPQALNLLRAIREGAVRVLQPPHWLAEVTAVIVRLQPQIVGDAIDLLHAMEFTTINDIEIYHIGSQLSERFNHHLFDTLYHAVAIHKGHTKFITDDEKYFQKASGKIGAIIRLADFSIFDI